MLRGFYAARAFRGELWMIPMAERPQQRLYFSPEPQGQGALRGISAV